MTESEGLPDFVTELRCTGNMLDIYIGEVSCKQNGGEKPCKYMLQLIS